MLSASRQSPDLWSDQVASSYLQSTSHAPPARFPVRGMDLQPRHAKNPTGSSTCGCIADCSSRVVGVCGFHDNCAAPVFSGTVTRGLLAAYIVQGSERVQGEGSWRLREH